MISFNELQKATEILSSPKWEDFDEDTWAWAVNTFDQGVYEWAATKDPEVLGKLFELFDDSCGFPEVMYSLVHAIEGYPDDIYVEGFLTNLEKGFEKYPEWYVRLCYRILNSEPTLTVFRKNLHFSTPEALIKLLDVISSESSNHRELIAELRSQILQGQS